MRQTLKSLRATLQVSFLFALGMVLLGAVAVSDVQAQPSVCIANASASEAAGTISFPITYWSGATCGSGVVVAPIGTFGATATPGTATAPADYHTIVVTPTAVTLTLVPDGVYELSEAFTVSLTSLVGVSAGDTEADGTITSPELPPVLSVAPAFATEGVNDLDFVVSILSPSEVDLTFVYDTADGGLETMAGAATSTGRIDFTAVVGGPGGIAASMGATSTTVTITINNDDLWESPSGLVETMSITISSPTDATIVTPSATGTITDNETKPVMSTSAFVLEGNETSEMVTLDFVVSISPKSDFDTSIAWETVDGTAKSFAESGVADPDYVDTSGTLTIPAGDASVTEEVEVVEDKFYEGPVARLETMTFDFREGLFLSTNSGETDVVTPVSDGIGTIEDDDPLTDFGDAPESYKVAGHYLTSATYLGALVDPDEVPLNSPNAMLDDDTDDSDEDGVLAAASFIPGGTTAVDVEIGDGGYLNIWFDWDADGTFDQPDDHIVSELVPAYTTQRYFVEVPATAVIPPTIDVLSIEKIYARFRICSVETECNIPYHEVDIATDGEAEDYEFVLSNDVTVTGTSEEEEETFMLVFDGNDYVVTDSEGVEVLRAPKTEPAPGVDPLNSLTVNADHFIVDFSEGSPIPPGDMTFNGNYHNSTLTLSQSHNNATVNDIEYTYVTDHDGEINFDGDLLTYTGLTPIFESLVAGNKTFTYPDVDEPALVTALTFQPEGKVIRLNHDGDIGGAGNGSSFIDCVLCGEETHFMNPTATLTINAGAGIDSVYVGRLDTVIPATFTTLNVNGGGPQGGGGVGGTTDLAHDYIKVTPSASYEINVDGGAPTTTDLDACVSPDVLDLDFSGVSNPKLTYTDFEAGEGTWTFNGQEDVNFTDIEMQNRQPYSVSMEVTPGLAYATDQTDIMVSVVNNGAHPIRCLQVDLPRELLAIGDGDPANDGTPYANAGFVGITSGDDDGDYKAADQFDIIDQFGAEVAHTFGDYFDENRFPTNVFVEGAFHGVVELGRGLGTGVRLDPGHTMKATWNDIFISNYLLMPEVYPVRARLQTIETGNENIGGLRYAPGTILAEDAIEFSKGFFFPVKSHVNTAVFVEKDLAAYGGTADYEQLIVGIFQGAPGITGSVWCRVPLEIVGSATFWMPPDGTLGGEESLHWRPCSGTNVADDPGTPAVDESRIALPFPLHPNKLFVDNNGTDGDLTDDILWLTTWGSAGLYKSEDFGESWMAAWPGIGPGNASIGAYWTNVYTITRGLNGFLYISANDGLMFHSLNRGQTWQQIGALPNVDADTPWSLLAHPDNERVIYAGTFGRGVYMSNDYGFTWMPLTSEAKIGDDDNENVDLYTDHKAGHIFDFAIDDLGEFLLIGTANGVWRADIDPDGSTSAVIASGTDDDGVLADGTEWEFLGHDVELDSGDIVTPEIRSLALQDVEADGLGDADDILVAGAWGAFLSDNRRTVSAFSLEDPFGVVSAGDPGDANDSFQDLALKGVSVSFVTVSPSGNILVGSATGQLIPLDGAAASTSTANEEPNAVIPESYALGQNYPNPFNPVTTIAFDLPATGNVRLAVYDVLGREVALLVSGSLEAGNHQVRFDAHNLPSGSYLYRLDTDKGSFTRQLVLMK